MSSCPRPCKPSGSAHRRAIRSQALIITLALVALASILVAAFFSMVSLDQTATESYSQSLKAEQLGLGGLHMIIGQLQQEMSKDAPPDTGGGSYPNSPIYTNVTSANILPQSVATNAAMPTLLKISAATNFYTGINGGTAAAFPNGSLMASAISSTAPSVNGRSVSLARWDQAYMGNFPSAADAPYWVLMTRSGPTNNGTLGSLTANSLNNPVYGNTNYVVGRMAYAIYDEGSLLDITVAGYPSSLAGYPSELAQTKGSLAGLNLTNALGITTAQSDALINWRNAASAAGGNPANFASYAQTNGFQTVYPGDTTFLSRQDLIQAAQNGTIGIATSQLTNLTTFTRELNAPSWGPSTPTGSSINYAAQADTSGVTNRFLPLVRDPQATTIHDYLDDGSPTTYTVNAGDPVVQRRFSLARLKWLGPNGPQNGGTAANILACFGLAWQESSDTNLITENTSIPYVWAYVGSSGGNKEATSIETLDQVAQENRQPNFFELLQAGILSGSIGVNSANGPAIPSGQEAGAGGSMLQILRIGANIINQYGSYSTASTFYPVVLEFQQSSGVYWQACGVEDLPDVSTISTITGGYPASEPPVGSLTYANLPVTIPAAVYLMFNLWNPNQVSSDSPNAHLAPPPVRLHVKGLYSMACFYGDGPPVLPLSNAALTGYPGYQITLDTTLPLAAGAADQGVEGFVNSQAITTADVASSSLSANSSPVLSAWTNTYPMGKQPRTNLVGLRLPDFTFATGKTPAGPENTSGDSNEYSIIYEYGNSAGPTFDAYMEFQTPSGAWIPYQFFTGNNDPATWISGDTMSIVSTLSAPAVSVKSPGTFALNYIAPLDTSSVTSDPVYAFYPYSMQDTPTPGPGSVYFFGGADFPLIYFSSDPRSLRFSGWQFDTTAQNNASWFNPIAGVEYAFQYSDLWVPAGAGTAAIPYPGGMANVSNLQEGFGGNWSGPPSLPVRDAPTPPTFPNNTSYYPAQLSRNNNGSSTAYQDGNNATGSATWTSYLDRDGVLRIGDSGYFTDTTGVTGNPTYLNAAPGGRSADHPIILRRPFNSVAEMGYAFRDDPWRSLDFFSGKSADAGLLDLFSLYATPTGIIHGRIDLNTRNMTTIQALLNGTVDDVMKTNVISPDAANAIAAAYTNITTTEPFVNKADLTTKFIGTSSFPTSGFASPDEYMVKPQREAAARALVDLGETRTWNLMIDLVAQVGKYPPNATALDQFVVDGERHYWLHVAIDRFTGKVIDQQLEVVAQ